MIIFWRSFLELKISGKFVLGKALVLVLVLSVSCSSQFSNAEEYDNMPNRILDLREKPASFKHACSTDVSSYRRFLQRESNRNGRGAGLGNDTSGLSMSVKYSRIDPLDGFSKYDQGYNIKDRHYWASVVFTGIYGYAIATALLVLGLMVITFLLLWNYKKKNSNAWKLFSYTHSDTRVFVLLLIIVILIILSLIFCTLAFVGNEKFHSQVKHVENTIVVAAGNATKTINNVTAVMLDIKNVLRPYNDRIASSKTFTSTRKRLIFEAHNIQGKVDTNKRRIDRVLHATYVAEVVITVTTIIVLILGLVCTSIYLRTQKWSWSVFLVIFLIWVLAILSWVVFGFYFAVDNVVDDTCLALEEYQETPYNTSLESVLPCVNLHTANSAVLKIREGMYTTILEANANISRLRALSSLGETRTFIPRICNPFGGPPKYRLNRKCSKGSITIGNIPKVLEPFKCSGNNARDCIANEGKYITNYTFNAILAYSTAAQSLIDTTPALESLTNCSFVVNAFALIVDENCDPVKRAARILWIAYAGISTCAVLFLVICWVVLYIARGSL